MVPLTLTLTQEGVPVAGAFVTLYPEDANSKWSAGGRSDEQGTVFLRTRGEFRGVASGTYRITVAKTELEENTLNVEPGGDPEAFNRSESKRKKFSLVDPIFAEQSSTTLKMRVESGMSQITLELGKAMRIRLP